MTSLIGGDVDYRPPSALKAGILYITRPINLSRKLCRHFDPFITKISAPREKALFSVSASGYRGTKIIKIGQDLLKLLQKVYCHVFVDRR